MLGTCEGSSRGGDVFVCALGATLRFAAQLRSSEFAVFIRVILPRCLSHVYSRTPIEPFDLKNAVPTVPPHPAQANSEFNHILPPCTTWRLYPLCPQSIAHTSRHREGVLCPYALQISLHLAKRIDLFFHIPYELPFPQLLCFHNHPHCAGASAAACP